MTNLTPQPRVDKNGKTTVRWVKPDSNGSAKPLPAVALPTAQPDTEQLRDELSEILNTAKYDEDQNVETFIEEASDEVISATTKFLKAEPEAAWQVAWMADREIEDDGIVEYLALYEMHSEWDDIEDTMRYLRGLHYFEANREWIDGSDDLSVVRNKALLDFTQSISMDDSTGNEMVDYVAIPGLGKYGTALVNQKAFDAVWRYPERVEDLIDFVRERGEAGVDLFNATADNGPDPLMRGQL